MPDTLPRVLADLTGQDVPFASEDIQPGGLAVFALRKSDGRVTNPAIISRAAVWWRVRRVRDLRLVSSRHRVVTPSQ